MRQSQKEDWGRTYQISSDLGGIPLCIDGSEETQQQGVADPLGPVVAAVALPAAADEGNIKPGPLPLASCQEVVITQCKVLVELRLKPVDSLCETLCNK